jgi:hypothetical protein
MLDLQHQYNNCTTISHMKVSPTYWGPPSCEGLLYNCCIGVVQESNLNKLILIQIDLRLILTNAIDSGNEPLIPFFLNFSSQMWTWSSWLMHACGPTNTHSPHLVNQR